MGSAVAALGPHGSSAVEVTSAQEGRKLALGWGMTAWPRGPMLPTLSVCRSQGWAAIIQGPRRGLGSAVSLAVSAVPGWRGPVASAEGLSPGPHMPCPGAAPGQAQVAMLPRLLGVQPSVLILL